MSTTEADVCAMAEAGFNAVRLPINWRVLMEDEPGITWRMVRTHLVCWYWRAISQT